MRFWKPFADLSRLFATSVEYDRLFDLTDRELATIGLTRDDLVRAFLADLGADGDGDPSPRRGEAVGMWGRGETRSTGRKVSGWQGSPA